MYSYCFNYLLTVNAQDGNDRPERRKRNKPSKFSPEEIKRAKKAVSGEKNETQQLVAHVEDTAISEATPSASATDETQVTESHVLVGSTQTEASIAELKPPTGVVRSVQLVPVPEFPTRTIRSYDPLFPVPDVLWASYRKWRSNPKMKDEERTVVYTFRTKDFFRTLEKNTWILGDVSTCTI